MRKFSTSLFIALLALLALPERVWAEDVSVKFLVRVADSDDVPTLYLWYSNNGSDVKPNGAWADTPTTSETETINGNTYYKYTITVPTETDLQLITKKSGSGGGNGCQSANSVTFQISSGVSVDYVLVKGNFNNTTPTVQVVNKSSETGNTFYLGCAKNNWGKDEGYKFTSESSSGPYTYTLAKGNVSSITTDGYFYVSILPYYNGKQWGSDAGNVERICPTNGDGTELTGSASNSNAQVSTTFTSWKVKYVENATDYVFTFNHSNMSFSVVPTLVSETKYTVNISAGEGGSVDPSGDQQIGSTPVEVTATAKSGYEFVNWTVTGGAKVANASSPTTTVTATQDGTLKATFNKSSTPDPTPTPTPILGNNFYLVGNFLNTDNNSINYDCRYFKLSETAAATAARDGVEEYSINIPTTLAVNVQILATDEDGSTELYGPDGEVTINKNNPSGSGSTTGTLVAASETLTNYFKFEDRTTGRTTRDPDANDGLYTITVTVTNGVPTNYTIKHNPLTRVAYYLPNRSDASVKESLNSRSGETAAFNNVFFGRVYLPAGVACYVLSNYLGDYDSDNNAITDTKTKLYLQGNKTGGNPQEGSDGYTKVYPITKNDGTPTDAKPFVFSETDIVAMDLEYAPRRGNNTAAYSAEGIYGEVIRSTQKALVGGSAIDVPTIEELRMVGPAVGDDTWNYNNGVVMKYNMAEQCWEATINTYAKAGAAFRFVANDTWENSWQENGTTEADKAKIPYDGNGNGHAATPADPNEVSYISSLTSADNRNQDYDIIFNRDPGKWRVRFYFTSKQIGTGNSYTYVFKYTINGYESVLRTYCSTQDEIPTDKSIKIYGAFAFDGNETNKSGTITLCEMNYIPAGQGVILSSTNAIEGWTFESYTPSDGQAKYKNIPDDQYVNYLKGTIEKTTVDASDFDGNNERTHRNFFFNYLKNTGYYKAGDTDYLGFFRIKSGSPCEAKHAYLHLPTNVLAWNGQTFGQVIDEFEANGEQQASLTKGMRIVFSDGSDWEDNTTTAISVVQQAKPADNAYYTLQGVRVAVPAKGIYIHNGKKIIIR